MNIKNHERKKGIQMQTDFDFTKNKLKKNVENRES